jgi:predicted RNA-binding protein with RPS1 domain
VVSTAKYGVFVNILPGYDGLVHVSELDVNRMDTEDWEVGDTLDVKCLGVGRLRHLLLFIILHNLILYHIVAAHLHAL